MPSDWTGLLPAFVFAETVGLALPVALCAWLWQFGRGGCFSRKMRRVLAGWVVLHSLGAAALWWIGAGTARAATVLVAGPVAALLLGLLPLAIGQRLLQRRGVPASRALQHTSLGWPPVLALAFGSVFLPAVVNDTSLDAGHLLAVGGPRLCLAGFCGLPLLGVATSALLAAVVVLCPGPVGFLIGDRLG